MGSLTSLRVIFPQPRGAQNIMAVSTMIASNKSQFKHIQIEHNAVTNGLQVTYQAEESVSAATATASFIPPVVNKQIRSTYFDCQGNEIMAAFFNAVSKTYGTSTLAQITANRKLAKLIYYHPDNPYHANEDMQYFDVELLEGTDDLPPRWRVTEVKRVAKKSYAWMERVHEWMNGCRNVFTGMRKKLMDAVK